MKLGAKLNLYDPYRIFNLSIVWATDVIQWLFNNKQP